MERIHRWLLFNFEIQLLFFLFDDRLDRAFFVWDLLIIFVVALVPQIPAVADTGLGVVAIEALVVIYAAEILIVEKPRTWDSLRWGLLGALFIMSVRGMF